MTMPRQTQGETLQISDSQPKGRGIFPCGAENPAALQDAATHSRGERLLVYDDGTAARASAPTGENKQIRLAS